MVLTVHDLKVDETIFENGDECMFVCNINIPEGYLYTPRPIFERVDAFVHQEYINIELVKYQVTATYELRHTDTGALRHWAGSFMPRENNLSSFDTFHLYGPDFVNTLLQVCDTNSIIASLLFHNIETKWVFDNLTSIVINLQARVPREFPTLIQRDLRVAHYGRQRRHITFPLP
jgi:hypothetical protein